MNFKEMEERKNDMLTRAEEILNSAKAEAREFTADEVSELTDIKEKVRAINETLTLDEEMRGLMEEKVDNEPKEEEMTEENKRSLEEIKKDEHDAFENYLRGRIVHERAGEMSTTEGGALIPTTIVDYIIRRVYDICPILERSQRFNVKGNLSLPFYPNDSDNITADYAEEFTALTSTTGGFGSVTLGGFLAGALTKVSRSLINNTNIDIVGFVVDEMAQQIARFIEHELLVGHPAVGQNPAKVLGLSTLTNGITSASTTAITAEELVRLQGCIKDRFQSNAVWIMSPATRELCRLLKSNTGYFLLNPDLTAPYGWSLLGKPVYVSDNMPAPTAGNVAIYYGDMHGLATKFSEEVNVQILRERYADEHAVGVVGWFEFDAKVCDEQQIAKLTMKAS